MKTISTAAALTALLLAGCATSEDPYPNIQIVTPNIVVGCKLVGNLSASTDNFGMFKETASEYRVKNAKKSAYRLGANRIVLSNPSKNGNTTTIDGQAYICP